MKKDGPIVIIDDDSDDQEYYAFALRKLNYANDLVGIANGQDALTYLKNPQIQPFMIISDVNMPVMNGFEIKDRIDADPELKEKCVPYVFMTTTVSAQVRKEVCRHNIDGLFEKPSTLTELEKTVRLIVDYLKQSITPF